jgi:hypothetical protein
VVVLVAKHLAVMAVVEVVDEATIPTPEALEQ